MAGAAPWCSGTTPRRSFVGRVHHVLAICRGEQGRAEEALGHSREALALLRETDDAAALARALNTLAGLTRDLGPAEEAVPIMDREHRRYAAGSATRPSR